MTRHDENLVETKLKDLASEVSRGVVTPPYSGVVIRAARRRRGRAIALVGAAAVSVLGIALIARPGGDLAVPDPALTPTPTPSSSVPGTALPLAEDGQVSDLFELAPGRLAVMYGQCPRGVGLCVPHFYLSGDDGQTWTERYEFDGSTDALVATEFPGQFAVSPVGDLAVLNAARATDAGSRAAAVFVAGDDPGMAVQTVGTVGPRRGADVTDPARAIVDIGGDVGYQILSGELSTLTVSRANGTPVSSFVITSAADGVLSAKVDQEHVVVSLDLGATWLPVPPIPGSDLRSSVRPQGPQRLVRFGYGPWQDHQETYPLSGIQVSDDRGRGWHIVPVRHRAGYPLVEVIVPLADGSFAGLTADSHLVHGTADGRFTESANGPHGAITAIGGHSGQAWATTDSGDLWFHDGTQAWRKLQLPE